MRYYGTTASRHYFYLLLELGKHRSLSQNFVNLLRAPSQEVITNRIRCIAKYVGAKSCYHDSGYTNVWGIVLHCMD